MRKVVASLCPNTSKHNDLVNVRLPLLKLNGDAEYVLSNKTKTPTSYGSILATLKRILKNVASLPIEYTAYIL